MRIMPPWFHRVRTQIMDLCKQWTSEINRRNVSPRLAFSFPDTVHKVIIQIKGSLAKNAVLLNNG